MPITNISKTAGAASMECGGAVDINLAVAAAPGAATQRVAIALILDRSGSMAGTPMLHLKAGAKEFVNIITDANAQSGGSMYEMGLISFAAEATTDVPLTGNIQTLNAAIEGLEAKGNTNQAGAFQQAGAMLQGFDGKKVAVMFTDGMPTVGGDPAPQADELKAGGVEIFCIGCAARTGWTRTRCAHGCRRPRRTMCFLPPRPQSWKKPLRRWRANCWKLAHATW